MTFMSDATYFDSHSESEVPCSDANNYCVADWDACGGEANAKGYFATTPCCESERESKIKAIIVVQRFFMAIRLEAKLYHLQP